jgi:hypothetical protein
MEVSHRLQALATLYLEEEAKVTIEGWVGPGADVDIFEKKNTVLLPGIKCKIVQNIA